MSIFELAGLVVVVAVIALLSRSVGRLFGISPWLAVIPLLLVAALVLRRIGGWLAAQRRRQVWPFRGGRQRRGSGRRDESVE